MANALRELARYGQSVWYDSLRRGILASGELARYVEDDGHDAELALLLPRPDPTC